MESSVFFIRWRPALLACALLSPIALQAAEVVVTVKETAIRSDRKFFAPTQGVAHYQDRLEVLEEAAGWYRIRQGKTQGWVHGSAVAGSADAKGGGGSALSGLGSALGALSGSAPAEQGYTQDEVALAGKGFNPEVEKNYRSRNPKAEFGAVDQMEQRQVSRKELMRFAEAGKLASRDAPLAAAAKAGGAESGAPQSDGQGGMGMGAILDGITGGASKIFGGGSSKPREEKPVWEN